MAVKNNSGDDVWSTAALFVIVVAVIVIIVVSGNSSGCQLGGTQHVRGYHKKDGTYVAPHERRRRH